MSFSAGGARARQLQVDVGELDSEAILCVDNQLAGLASRERGVRIE
jgi:hypothetical protein